MSGPIQKSIFAEHGFKTVVAHLMEEIQFLYMATAEAKILPPRCR
jgi:hypothetical protein